ncbi:MAG: creatininase family protein [Hadesarchaea archaeon]|nr:creatininase family protein [Hadesarchaea archaeon]
MLAEHLTWKQIEEYLRGKSDVIIPVGSTEEHGYHLPLSTDTIIAYELAKAVGERLGILVMPPIPYGICRHTTPYPGTTGVSFDSLRNFVGDVLSDLWAKGFKAFYLITGHAGSAHKVALREAGRTLAVKGAEVYVIDPYEMGILDLLEENKLPQFPGHADEVETSLMLYQRPELVDEKKIVDELPKLERFRLVEERPTVSGVFGRPTLASKEKGEKIFNGMVDGVVKIIRSRELR